jgi:membrane-associated phospholipid phosphatase
MKTAVADRNSRRVALAQTISHIFHPLLVVIPTMLASMWWFGATPAQALGWTLVAALMVNLPVLLVIEYGVRFKHYSDRSISIRQERPSIFAAGAVFFILLLILLWAFEGPRVLLASLLAALAATLLAAGLNRLTKVSLHSVAMAGCAAVFWAMTPALGLLMAVFSILVGWSRFQLGHHTPAQILIGWTVAVVCVEVAFRLIL